VSAAGPRIAVLNYHMSNLRSATKALELLGADVAVAERPEQALGADGIVLPGVGHFGSAMERIREHGLDEVARTAAAEGIPLLGICLGLQLLFDASQESPGVAGLGLIPGDVRRLQTSRKLPQIGWNRVTWHGASALVPAESDASASTYYFVHSYAVVPADPTHVLGTVDYGGQFVAAAHAGHVSGVQFHPEKSSRAGLALLRRWLASVPRRAEVVPA
jgi:imidazole glycerol phosphate synthase glutamine amidotransferase subunit